MSDEPKSFSAPESEPTVSRSPMPMWIFAVLLILLFVGGIYFDHASGWFDSQVYGPYLNAEQLDAYQPKSGAAAFLAQGKKTYETVCGICHGPDGMGKPAQAPPLAGSEWVMARGDLRLAHIPLTGVTGDIQVEGKDWNMSMAPMGAALSDSDLAAVLTYIRSSWGNKADAVTPDDVKKVRASVAGKPAINGEQELKATPE
jgi:mono/diheme cytochrome c family protein